MILTDANKNSSSGVDWEKTPIQNDVLNSYRFSEDGTLEQVLLPVCGPRVLVGRGRAHALLPVPAAVGVHGLQTRPLRAETAAARGGNAQDLVLGRHVDGGGGREEGQVGDHDGGLVEGLEDLHEAGAPGAGVEAQFADDRLAEGGGGGGQLAGGGVVRGGGGRDEKDVDGVVVLVLDGCGLNGNVGEAGQSLLKKNKKNNLVL